MRCPNVKIQNFNANALLHNREGVVNRLRGDDMVKEVKMSGAKIYFESKRIVKRRRSMKLTAKTKSDECC